MFDSDESFTRDMECKIWRNRKTRFDLSIAPKLLWEDMEAAYLQFAKKEGEFLEKFEASNIQLGFLKLKKGFDLNIAE